MGRHRIRSSLLGPGTRPLGKQDVAGVSFSPEEELVWLSCSPFQVSFIRVSQSTLE